MHPRRRSAAGCTSDRACLCAVSRCHAQRERPLLRDAVARRCHCLSWRDAERTEPALGPLLARSMRTSLACVVAGGRALLDLG
ncbi:Hypothetical protein A7982_07439 [Minicystis rosea]|nr:Hypothetical protein A7982_07439 [Minicystis rosea]